MRVGRPPCARSSQLLATYRFGPDVGFRKIPEAKHAEAVARAEQHEVDLVKLREHRDYFYTEVKIRFRARMRIGLLVLGVRAGVSRAW